jgi:hypothetical protein
MHNKSFKVKVPKQQKIKEVMEEAIYFYVSNIFCT